MPDSFTDIEKVTRSHILAANMLARLEVHKKGNIIVPGDDADAITILSGGTKAVAPLKDEGKTALFDIQLAKEECEFGTTY